MNLRKTTDGKKWALTSRDIKVVELLSKGNAALDIAKLGGISTRTVEGIVAELKHQYKCENTAHLVSTFLRKKLIK